VDRILVGYDGSPHASRALERAAALAGRGAGVTVVAAVHVRPHVGRGPGAGPVDPVEAAERRAELEDAEAFLSERGIEGRMVAGLGDPAAAIVAEAREWGADLIVVGTRGLSLAGRLVLGSVSTKVLHDAPCDVLVVR
jgi:nucleotide-binding universal stress UspA family protein